MRLQSIVMLAAVSLCGLVPASGRAQNTPTASLLVLSKHDHTLSMVDPATLQVIARMPVGDDPHEVTASPDGTTAYVSNYGSHNTLAVIDLVGHRAMPSIDLGPLRSPHGLTFIGGKTWFTAEGAKAIGRYDPATRKVDWILGTGQNRTHMIYVSEDQKRILTTNVSSGTVSIIDLEPARMGPPSRSMMPGPPPGPRNGAPGPMTRLDWNETIVRVGNGSEGFDISPDRKEAWVANAQDGTISIINLSAKRVVETLQANVPSANRLKFTADGKRVLVSMLGSPDVAVFDAASRHEIKRIPVGHGAAGIVMQPDGARAFVACTPDNYVAVINLSTSTVTGHIDAGGEPDGMTWTIRR